MSKISIWFFRGLNTYGDEVQHLGPLTFGSISRSFHHYFSDSAIEIITVEGQGFGEITTQVENARLFVLNHPKWRAQSAPAHFLGHSLGGLVARALVRQDEFRQRIKSLTTIGTPHRGTPVAGSILNFDQTHPRWMKALKFTSYDVAKKKRCFAPLTPKACADFNQEYPNVREIVYAHVGCAIDRNLLSLPYRVLLGVLADRPLSEPHDGLVELSSQKWGQDLGVFALDHLMEVGFCFDLRSRIRQHFRHEHLRMVKCLRDFWLNSAIYDRVKIQSR